MLHKIFQKGKIHLSIEIEADVRYDVSKRSVSKHCRPPFQKELPPEEVERCVHIVNTWCLLPRQDGLSRHLAQRVEAAFILFHHIEVGIAIGRADGEKVESIRPSFDAHEGTIEILLRAERRRDIKIEEIIVRHAPRTLLVEKEIAQDRLFAYRIPREFRRADVERGQAEHSSRGTDLRAVRGERNIRPPMRRREALRVVNGVPDDGNTAERPYILPGNALRPPPRANGDEDIHGRTITIAKRRNPAETVAPPHPS